MKAAYLKTKGGPQTLIMGEIPQPTPGPGEALVKVHATAVMPTELDWVPTFNQPSGQPRPFPIVLSHEFSGVVEAVGPEVAGVNIGESVHGLNDWFTNGAQAEYCVVAATALASKPKSLDHTQAAAVPISALTAWQGLFEKTKLTRGQSVLIHGAAGGVGTFAVQLAHWCGAQVMATASAANGDFVRSLGADTVIDYHKTRFEDVVKNVDVVFDAVGGEALERSWSVLKSGGKLVTISSAKIADPEPRVRDAFILVRADGRQLKEIGELIDLGYIKVYVAEIFPLAKAREAYAFAEQRSKRGKVILQVIE